jgi:bla regulator protein blaR1
MTSEYLSPLANHLWQSTLFAGIAGLLTLAMRKNRASVRYWLWFAASVKFLIPFSLFIATGARFEWSNGLKMTPPHLSAAMDQVTQPFAAATTLPLNKDMPAAPDRMPILLAAIWLCGVAISLFRWLREWLRIRAVAREASPCDFDLRRSRVPVKVASSSALLEPCVFGLFRPVLLLPEGIRERLTPGQLKAILVHELLHVRRRDNLAAAIHMVVETIFWFYPLVFWIGKQLIQERERACDESVLQMTGEPEIYAQGILNICKLYIESSPVCAAGVTGSNLKRRIEEIMTNRGTANLNTGKKLMLAAAAGAAVAIPLLAGVMNAPLIHARSQDSGRVAFEVASVKANHSTSRGFGGLQFLPGRVTGTKVVLSMAVIAAYDIPTWKQLTGESPILDEVFDFDARAAANAIPADASPAVRNAQLRLMMQRLLADRFKLVVHRETKELPIYALVIAKNGPRLKSAARTCATDSECGPQGGGPASGLRMVDAPLSRLAEFLGVFMDRHVVDRTGLQGHFDMQISSWNPSAQTGTQVILDDHEPAPSATDPSIFTVVQEQLGLKLEATRGQVELLVVDHVERPAEN